MTNQQIVAAYKQEQNIPLDTPLYTYGAWRNQGFQVKQGERCKHRVKMFKYVPAKDVTSRGHCYRNCMYLFERSQVEPINNDKRGM